MYKFLQPLYGKRFSHMKLIRNKSRKQLETESLQNLIKIYQNETERIAILRKLLMIGILKLKTLSEQL